MGGDRRLSHMSRDRTICLETPNALLVLARRDDIWTFAHLGGRGGIAADLAALAAARPYGANHCAAGTAETYPAFGSSRGQPGCRLGDTRGALQVRHADGDLSADWRCVRTSATPPRASCGGSAITIEYADRRHPSFRAAQHFVAYGDCDVFETWIELTHREKEPVALSRMDSFCLASTGLGDRFHLLSLSGAWTNEAGLAEDEVKPGREVLLGARCGVHDAWENNPAFFLSFGAAPATEDAGRVLAGALCWSGAWEIRVRHEMSHELRLTAGAANPAGPYVLEPGRTLVLPKFVFAWSERGKGEASRALHRWARLHLLPHPGLRDIVLNSWEGVRFGLEEHKILSMMDGAKTLGAELFVVDDGWFGRGEFARNDASHGLGDWVEDPAKLPRGLAHLAQEAKKRGLAFGLWLEPEMADTRSELVRAHPDWVLRETGRPLRTQRGDAQVVLDLANPAVRDHLFHRVDAVIRSIPGLAYVKWDANADIANFGSPFLGPQRQGNLWFDYAAGLCDLLARLRAAHPSIVIQACASGGGRAEFGVLAFADEFWTSDNTCAQQRVLIQWGLSLFYPACAMAAHVTASPNKQTGRAASLKFRFDVAFSGRLGFELRPEELAPEETAFARRCVADYKRLRPVIQGGDLHRLASPLDGDHAALMFTSPDRRRAVVAVYGLSRRANAGRPAPLRLVGLDPSLRYRIREINLAVSGQGLHTAFHGKTLGGGALVSAGLPFLLAPGDDSFVLELRATAGDTRVSTAATPYRRDSSTTIQRKMEKHHANIK